MRHIAHIAFLFFLVACGADRTPDLTYSDRCIIDVWHTRFEYTVKKHPNGDAEVLCRVNDTETKEYYEANHFNIQSLDCFVGSDWLERWHFHYSGDDAFVDWNHSTQPIDAESGQALPYRSTFYNCEPELTLFFFSFTPTFLRNMH